MSGRATFAVWRRFPTRGLTFAAVLFAAILLLSIAWNAHALELQVGANRRLIISDGREIILPGGQAEALTWSRDGKYLAAAGAYGNDISVWDQAGHEFGGAFRHGLVVGGSIAILNDRNEVVFDSDANMMEKYSLSVWDMTTRQPKLNFAGRGEGSAFELSPDSTTLAVENFSEALIILYDAKLFKIRGSIKVPPGVTKIKFCPSGRGIVAGDINGSLYFVNLDSKVVTKIANPFFRKLKLGGLMEGALNAIALSPNSDRALVGAGIVVESTDFIRPPRFDRAGAAIWLRDLHPISVWRISDGKKLSEFPGNAKAPIRVAVWDPKGRFVAFTDSAGSLYFWALDSVGAPYVSVHFPFEPMALAISPDGSELAVSSIHGARTITITESRG